MTSAPDANPRKPIKILVIEHCPNDAHLLRILLSGESHYSLTVATQLVRGVTTVGFSVGFASHQPSSKNPKSLEQLMIEADQAMYAGKLMRPTSRAFQGMQAGSQTVVH